MHTYKKIAKRNSRRIVAYIMDFFSVVPAVVIPKKLADVKNIVFLFS